jgi:hypothetical protein
LIPKIKFGDQMPGRSKALEREVIPAWNAFLRGLLQGRAARRMLAEALIERGPKKSKKKAKAATLTMIARIQAMTARGSTVYPTATTTGNGRLELTPFRHRGIDPRRRSRWALFCPCLLARS